MTPIEPLSARSYHVNSKNGDNLQRTHLRSMVSYSDLRSEIKANNLLKREGNRNAFRAGALCKSMVDPGEEVTTPTQNSSSSKIRLTSLAAARDNRKKSMRRYGSSSNFSFISELSQSIDRSMVVNNDRNLPTRNSKMCTSLVYNSVGKILFISKIVDTKSR